MGDRRFGVVLASPFWGRRIVSWGHRPVLLISLVGFMSAPTLLATRAGQCAVAGLVGSISALAFMAGPLLGTGLYEIAPTVPYLLGAVLLAGLAVLAFAHPGIRQLPAPLTNPDATSTVRVPPRD